MPQIDVYSLKGTKKGKVSLPSSLFAAKINPTLMAQAVRVYLSNQRRARAKTKTRGEVVRTKAKVWRQKGTGRARHGSKNAPIFVGGGVAHGPRGDQNYKLRLSKKMRRQALASALTAKLKEKEILVVDGLEEIAPKTREMVQVLAALGLEKRTKKLLVLGEDGKNILLASRNIKDVTSVRALSLSTYQVLNAGKVVFVKNAIKSLEKTFAKKGKNG